ncbi:Kif18a [Nucleospora cyclopteri]
MTRNEEETILTFCRTNDKIKPKHDFTINKHSVNVNGKEYKVDYVIQNKSQAEVFSIVKNFVIKNGEMGYNCTVFAYGQTGSGKTYTIRGTHGNLGLIPRVLEYLHKKYDKMKISFVEIYNEILIDLCSEKREPLSIRETNSPNEHLSSVSNTIYVEGLNVFKSCNLKESMEFYSRGIRNRKISATKMNDASSRSHAIFTIVFENNQNNVPKTSRLTFVDLAGSEKLKDSPNDTIVLENNKQFKETTNINKSLLYLGIIVNSLGKKDIKHVPYRDSKLTYLLKDSLGGNSKLCIIGNINLAFMADSVNTLQFLQRVKMIKNKPTINYEIFDTNIKDAFCTLENENLKLKRELQVIKNSKKFKHSEIYSIKQAKEEISTLQKDFADYKADLKEFFNQYYKKQGFYKKIDEDIEEIKDLYKSEVKKYFKEI